MLTPLGRKFVPAPFKFDKPSNSLFLPPEFASVNCSLCEGQTTSVSLSASVPLFAQQSESVYASAPGECNIFGNNFPWVHRVTFGDGSISSESGSNPTFDHTWNNPGNYNVTDSITCSCNNPFAILASAHMDADVASDCPTQTQPADSKPPSATYPDFIYIDNQWHGGRTEIAHSTSGLSCAQVCPGKFRITGDIEIVHEMELTFVKVSKKLPAYNRCKSIVRNSDAIMRDLAHEDKHASNHLATLTSYKSRIVGDYGSMDDCISAKKKLKKDVQSAMYNQAVDLGNHVDHKGEPRYYLHCPSPGAYTQELQCGPPNISCSSNTY